MNWKKLAEKTLYEGWRGMIQKTFELPDGQIADFDIIQNGVFVTIAAFTVEKEAILVRQFRPGPEMILVSFPEGYVDEKETPEVAARRELLEETGYEAGNIKHLKTFYSAYSTECNICLLAVNCKKVKKQALDGQEFIEVFTLSLEKFRTLLQDEKDDSLTTVNAAYLALDALNFL